MDFFIDDDSDFSSMSSSNSNGEDIVAHLKKDGSSEKEGTRSSTKEAKVKLPAQGPVQNRCHEYTSNENNTSGGEEEHWLRPSSTVLECNGSDIQLLRGATNIPSAANIVVAPPPKQIGKTGKTKHRFLLVWPGILSVNPRRNNQIQSTKEKSEKESAHLESYLEDKEPNNTALGIIQGLCTDTPALKIPFRPLLSTSLLSQKLDRNFYLTFQGEKMESSSKFMMLSCSRKGNVIIKNIFNSVVVFGDATCRADHAIPRWLQPMLVNSNINNSKDTSDGNLKSQTFSDYGENGDVVDVTHRSKANSAESPSIRHFGGSERAVDGGRKGLREVKRVIPFASARNGDIQQLDNFHHSDSDLNIPRKQAEAAIDLANLTINTCDCDDEHKAGVGREVAVLPKRRTPRRTAYNRAVQYDYDEPSSSLGQEEESQDDNSEEHCGDDYNGEGESSRYSNDRSSTNAKNKAMYKKENSAAAKTGRGLSTMKMTQEEEASDEESHRSDDNNLPHGTQSLRQFSTKKGPCVGIEGSDIKDEEYESESAQEQTKQAPKIYLAKKHIEKAPGVSKAAVAMRKETQYFSGTDEQSASEVKGSSRGPVAGGAVSAECHNARRKTSSFEDRDGYAGTRVDQRQPTKKGAHGSNAAVTKLAASTSDCRTRVKVAKTSVNREETDCQANREDASKKRSARPNDSKTRVRIFESSNEKNSQRHSPGILKTPSPTRKRRKTSSQKKPISINDLANDDEFNFLN